MSEGNGHAATLDKPRRKPAKPKPGKPADAPLYDVDAERALLGSIIHDGRALDDVYNIVTDRDFFLPEHGALWEAFCLLWLRGEPVNDIPIIRDWMKESGAWEQIGGPAGFRAISRSVVNSAHAKYHAQIVRDFAVRRAELARLERGITEIQRGATPERLLQFAIEGVEQLSDSSPRPRFKAFTIDLAAKRPPLRPPIIEGILRRGETANIIAAPKVGKSWLSYGLALCAVTGGDWFGRFPCTPGNVLLIDNELHRETIEHRIPEVADKLDVKPADCVGRFDVWPLRGCLMDLRDIIRKLEREHRPGEFALIILDSWYRALPAGVSESDHSQITELYNLIDAMAGRFGCAWVNVHHASKGSQANKDTTDVGAGAGTQSRCVDAHLILRPHEVTGCAVLDAAIRSWAPIEPLVLKWDFPRWSPIEGLDPSQLKGSRTKSEQRQREMDQEGMAAIVDALRAGPATVSQVRKVTGMGKERATRLLGMLEREGRVASQGIETHGNEATEYRLKDGGLSEATYNVPDNGGRGGGSAVF